jgi:hypothetical protein
MHRRNRIVVAVVFTALLTGLMWTDSPTTWWSSIIEFFMASNSSITSSVIDVRPSGDLDLHVVLWATASCVWWWAFRQSTDVLKSLSFLAVWAMVVETLQPIFTDIRDRQLGDYIGNAIGIGLIVLAVLVRERYFDGPIFPAT